MLPAGRRRQTHTGSISQTRRTAFHSAPFSTESFILKFFFGNKYVRRGADEVCMRHKQKESWKTRVAALIQDKYWVEVQFWGTGVFLFYATLYFNSTTFYRHFENKILLKPFFSPLGFTRKKKICKKVLFCVFLMKFLWPGFTHEKKNVLLKNFLCFSPKCLFSCIHKIKTPAKFSQKKNVKGNFVFSVRSFLFFPKNIFEKKSNLKFSLVEIFTVKPSEKIFLVNVIKTSRFFSFMKSDERKIH